MEQMHIDFNETESAAMDAFARGDAAEGSQLQKQFLADMRQAIKNGLDHCSCTASCEYHGKCFLCVQIHRGHGSHLPACMRAMVNRKIESLSALTEHTITDCIKKPSYLEPSFQESCAPEE